MTLVNNWNKYIKKNPKGAMRYLGLFICTIFSLYLFTIFLEWNETREGGFVINDWLLKQYKATNVSVPIFVGTYFGIISGLASGLGHPRAFLYMLIGAILIVMTRTVTLYFVPLVEPEGLRPLRDFLLEGTFYSGKIMKRDLFFSGHTANIFLLAFLTPKTWLRPILLVVGCCVGGLLLLQKAHYTIDVVAAPIIAYLVAILTKKVTDKICPYLELGSNQ